MEVKNDPRIVLSAQDINEIVRTIGGKSIELDDGRLVSFEVDMRNEDEFADKLIHHFLKDASTSAVTDAVVHAARSSHGDWTGNEIESLVAVLNEKYGTGRDREDFMLAEEFAHGSSGDVWSEGDVEEFMEEVENIEGVEQVNMEDRQTVSGFIQEALDEEEESSMLDQFDPNDTVKQKAAVAIERELGLTEELSMEIAHTLRENDLLAENE